MKQKIKLSLTASIILPHNHPQAAILETLLVIDRDGGGSII
jgi:hypothetical protein